MAEDITSFEDFKLNRQLLSAIEALGYKEPTLIQKKAIPLILAGHDLLGIAQTGTGKTAAYLLPILMKIKYAQGQHPRALILAPTRELVMQIEENGKALAVNTDIRFVALYGGIGPKTQIEILQKGVDIIITTPGRFIDIYRAGEIYVKDLKVMVLDEADKMMDMGFIPQIRKILEIIPVKRQNLLFSATMPEKVVKLSEEFLEFPEVAEVTPQATTVETINQVAYHVPNFKTKINLLSALLSDSNLSRVIIFVKTKEIADNIHKFITRKIDPKARVIHGNKGQNSRINAIEEFKSGDLRILIATDVAARGLDVSMVSHVINFDVPLIYQDYVHRIGRTGRAQNTGEAITFITEPEKVHVERIEKLIRQPIPVLPLPESLIIEETGFSERQAMARAMDDLRKKEDPTFKGAFHEKKKKPTKKESRSGGTAFKPGMGKAKSGGKTKKKQSGNRRK